jgi:hypothetical protein
LARAGERELGLVAEATANFEGAAKLNPAAFAPVYNLGCWSEQGDVQRGITLLRQAADLDERDLRALLRIGDGPRTRPLGSGPPHVLRGAETRPAIAAAATGLAASPFWKATCRRRKPSSCRRWK